jgi:hypothetical protein
MNWRASRTHRTVSGSHRTVSGDVKNRGKNKKWKSVYWRVRICATNFVPGIKIHLPEQSTKLLEDYSINAGLPLFVLPALFKSSVLVQRTLN